MNSKQFIWLALAALIGYENVEAADCSKYTGINLMVCAFNHYLAIAIHNSNYFKGLLQAANSKGH